MTKHFFLRIAFILFAAAAFGFFLLIVGKALGHDLRGISAIVVAIRHLDVGWFEEIAAHGYRIVPGDAAQSSVFFPLYPFLGWGFTRIFQIEPHFALLLAQGVAWLCLAPALAWFSMEMDKEEDLKGAGNTMPPPTTWSGNAGILLLSLFVHPAAFFLFVPYTEALFLAALFCLAALMLRFRNFEDRVPLNVLLAVTACAFVASATRVTGLFLAPGFALAALWKFPRSGKNLPSSLRDFLSNEATRVAIAVAVGCILALSGFMLLLHESHGDALAFYRYRASGWQERPSLENLKSMFNPAIGGRMTFQSLMASVTFFLPAFFLRHERLRGMTLFCLTATTLSIIQGKYGDMTRYSLALVPVWFFAFKRMEKRPVLLAAVSGAMAIYGSVLWDRWLSKVWVG